MSLHRLPLLLVEDNPAHALLVRHCLENQPVVVYHVDDGEAALDYLRHQGHYLDPVASPRPRLILLDLNLPKIDGFAVLGQVKASAALSTIPVVILTTSDAIRDKEQASALGADGYIVKPSGIEAFAEALETHCENFLKRSHA